jgi:alkylhydroperoxidase/carboxymuconolactone decarboxylase family protein YurZ
VNIDEIFDKIRKSGEDLPRPLELYGNLDEKSALAHISSKNVTFEQGAMSSKSKALAAISAAVALDAPACILNNVKMSRKTGASKKEIMEAIAVGRFVKSSTVISSSAPALEWIASLVD